MDEQVSSEQLTSQQPCAGATDKDNDHDESACQYVVAV